MANSTITPKLIYPCLFALVGLFGCNPDEDMSPAASLSGSAVSAAADASGKPGVTMRANHYIVIASGDALPAGIDRELRSLKGNVTSLLTEAGVATVSSDDPDFAAKASKINGVRSVVRDLEVQWYNPDKIRTLELTDEANVNPPSSGDNDPLFPLQWGHTAIQAPAAWNTGARGKGVRVAVLDSGFDFAHPDLAPNIDVRASASFVAGEPKEFNGTSFSHGTHVAGTIAAADNAIGVVGVAPEATLILVKVLRDSGSGAFGWIMQGIVHAANEGADVINMSLGASLPRNGRYLLDNGTPDDPSDDYWVNDTKATQELLIALNRVTTYATRKGATVIASAGNDANNGNKDKSLVHVPSGSLNVISISATGPMGWANDMLNANLDRMASYSNYGTADVAFAAPGGDYMYPTNEIVVVHGVMQYVWALDMVLSTRNPSASGSRYTWSAGTSMASPHAAGVAALIIGQNGGQMDLTRVAAALRASADDLGKPGRDPFYGHGRVNAYRAVTQVQ